MKNIKNHLRTKVTKRTKLPTLLNTKIKEKIQIKQQRIHILQSIRKSEVKRKSLSLVQHFATHGLQSPWNSAGQNSGMDSHQESPIKNRMYYKIHLVIESCDRVEVKCVNQKCENSHQVYKVRPNIVYEEHTQNKVIQKG